MVSSSECTILILSCDKNISVLNIFESYFKKYWKDCPFPVYVGLEKYNKEYEGWLTLQSEEKRWGKRVKEYLKQINTKYVIIMLDDFVVEKIVDTQIVIEFLSIIRSDDNIATISFADIYDDNEPTQFKDLVKRKWNADYLLNLQVGIWNKATLISLIRDTESPWQVELFGSIRARKLREKTFLCLKSDEIAPYKYGRGWLMVRGLWNGNEIKRLGLYEYARDLFDDRDIVYSNLMHIDFLSRIKRRIQIDFRKALSVIGIYL